jgi:hypothetical protein
MIGGAAAGMRAASQARCRNPQARLGAQMAGRDVVVKRIDVFVMARAADMTLRAIESLDLAYAPPIAPVYHSIPLSPARREHGKP